jgi:hypothetical protein
MRKIFCYNDALLEVFYKEFERDNGKFFRASKVTLDHMKDPFTFKGNSWKIVGQVDDREMVCRNLDDNTVWAIERLDVQRAILGETNLDFNKLRNRKLKPLSETGN